MKIRINFSAIAWNWSAAVGLLSRRLAIPQKAKMFHGLRVLPLSLLISSCASLHTAIEDGNETAVRRIVEKDKTILEKPVGGKGNYSGYLSPLNFAILNDRLNIAGQLFGLGAPVDRPVGARDMPAARFCIANQKPMSFCGRLLEKVDLKKHGSDLLEASHSNPQALKYLLDRGVSADTRFADGSNALFHSFNPEVVRLLLERGARPDVLDQENQTALHVRCSVDRITVKKGEGANADTRSSIRILYRARPESIKVRDKNDQTPADLSAYCATLAGAAPAQPGFSDTILLKSGETITNVKATVTRDSVIISDSSGNTRTFTKDKVAGVKTGDR